MIQKEKRERMSGENVSSGPDIVIKMKNPPNPIPEMMANHRLWDETCFDWPGMRETSQIPANASKKPAIILPSGIPCSRMPYSTGMAAPMTAAVGQPVRNDPGKELYTASQDRPLRRCQRELPTALPETRERVLAKE